MRSIPLIAGLLALGALSGCGIGDAQQRLRTAVDEKREELSRCYADTLTRDRNAAGTVSLSLHVEDNSGAVDDVRVEQSDIEDPQLAECLSATLRVIRLYPKPPAAALRVQYTLQFTPEG